MTRRNFFDLAGQFLTGALPTVGVVTPLFDRWINPRQHQPWSNGGVIVNALGTLTGNPPLLLLAGLIQVYQGWLHKENSAPG